MTCHKKNIKCFISMGHKTFAFGKPCVPTVLLGGQDYVIIS